MIKNKKIIAALCAAAVVASFSIPVAAETTGSGYTYGQTSEGKVMASDGTLVNVSIGNTYGATEDQKAIYANFANYLDGLYMDGIINNDQLGTIKADAAYIIINGGDPTDGEYYLNNPDVDYDATLVLNVTSGYDTNVKYVSSAGTTNTIEEKLVETSSGGGTVTKSEVTSTVTQALKIESTDQNAALLNALFMGQTTDSVQAAINSGTLGEGGKNLIKQVQGGNASINGVIYGNQTFNDFCETRGLSYQDAANYVISLGTMDPDSVPAVDKELASAVRNMFEVSDGAAHETIMKNMMDTMEKNNEKIAEAQAYLRDLVITEVEGKKVIYVVNEDAGVGYMDPDSGEFIEIGTIGEGTKYIEGTAYTAISYFNKEHYDGEKLFNSLQILFPGCDISGYYESYINAPDPIPDDFGEQITRMIQEIQANYYGEGGPGEGDYTRIPIYGGCKPESFLITTANMSGVTSDIVTSVAGSKEIHRAVDTMVFELQRFDGLPIMDEERAYTDAEIFASLYNMYFTPEVRAKDLYSDSVFTILDLYMQLHAQTYGKVGMPPITIEYNNDTAIYTLDFKTGLQKMAKTVGISYEDFVRNYFSSYTRPSADEWLLDPSMHTYSFYPQETQTNYVPSLTQTNRTTGQTEPYYLGTIHSKSEIRGNSLLTSKLFQNAGNMIRAVGNVGGIYDDKYLKTDSVRPLLLTLRPEISSVYNVHVYTTGTIFEDYPARRNVNTDTTSEGHTWYFYPYREVLMAEGGRFSSEANYAEKWDSVRNGTTTVEAQEKLAVKYGAEELVRSIIEENNRQFSVGRGDIASFYNYVIYNGENTSNMSGAYSQGIEAWIAPNKGLTAEQQNAVSASKGEINAESFLYDIYELDDNYGTLKVPLDSNGEPLYNISYGAVKCAYGGGGSSSASDYESAIDRQQAAMNAFGNVMNNVQYGTNEEIVNAMNSAFGTNVQVGNDGNIHTENGVYGSAEAYFQSQIMDGNLTLSSGGSSSGSSTGSTTTSSSSSSDLPSRIHGSPGDAWPDECAYYPECCTRYFIARWNSKAVVPYVVMDDVSPKIYDSANLISQPYEAERITEKHVKLDDSVFHWRWSQTLEADPNGKNTTPFETTTGTLPVYTNPVDPVDPNNPSSDPNPSMQTTPNRNPGNPDETTYRTTGKDLPPMPTPITIPPANDSNGGGIVIEQFISK